MIVLLFFLVQFSFFIFLSYLLGAWFKWNSTSEIHFLSLYTSFFTADIFQNRAWTCMISICLVLCTCSVRRKGAGLTWLPRRSSLCSTTLSWTAKAGWGAAAAQRTPGTAAARWCLRDSSRLRTRLQSVPRACLCSVLSQCVKSTSANTQACLHIPGSSPLTLRCRLGLWWASSAKRLLGSPSLWS